MLAAVRTSLVRERAVVIDACRAATPPQPAVTELRGEEPFPGCPPGIPSTVWRGFPTLRVGRVLELVRRFIAVGVDLRRQRHRALRDTGDRTPIQPRGPARGGVANPPNTDTHSKPRITDIQLTFSHIIRQPNTTGLTGPKLAISAPSCASSPVCLPLPSYSTTSLVPGVRRTHRRYADRPPTSCPSDAAFQFTERLPPSGENSTTGCRFRVRRRRRRVHRRRRSWMPVSFLCRSSAGRR